MRISDWSSDVCSSDLFKAGIGDLLALFIIKIDAGAGLAAMASRLDHLVNQRARAEFLAEHAMQILENRQARIPSGQIAQFQRPHRVVERHTQRGVDILRGRSEEHTSELQSLMR